MQIYNKSLKQCGIDYVIFGHIGENHLHVNLIPKDKAQLNQAKAIYMELAKKVVQMNGSLSGEHGIGKLKKHLLREMYNQKLIDKCLEIKTCFDPFHCIGRGTLFDT